MQHMLSNLKKKIKISQKKKKRKTLHLIESTFSMDSLERKGQAFEKAQPKDNPRFGEQLCRVITWVLRSESNMLLSVIALT